jgi:class 3 adenylate cyclase
MRVEEPQTWTLAFADPAREAEFMEAYSREVRRFYKFAMVAITLLWVASVGLDLAAAPGQRTPFLIIRFGLVLPVLLAGTAIAFAPRPIYRRWWQVMAIAMFAVVLAGTVGLLVVSTPEVFRYTVAGFLLTMLFGAGVDLVRTIYVLVVGTVLAIAMAIALLTSPHTSSADVAVNVLWVGVALVGAIMISGRAEIARRFRFVQGGLLAKERARSEALLMNLLPAPIAARLKDGPKIIADGLDSVTVLFGDLKGFTGLAKELTPEELVERLDRVFTAFDGLAQRHGLEKIKTMGDAYMAVAGAPFARADHALIAARMALAMIATLGELEPTLALRIGLATGPVVAGVIGRTKQSYDLWGETVNLASRMESHGVPGRIQVSRATHDLLALAPEIALESRGLIELKGLGPTETYLIAAAPDAGSR